MDRMRVSDCVDIGFRFGTIRREIPRPNSDTCTNASLYETAFDHPACNTVTPGQFQKCPNLSDNGAYAHVKSPRKEH